MLDRALDAVVGRWRPSERGLEQPFVPTVAASQSPSRKEGAEMFNLPIDTSAMTFLVGASAEPIRERGTNRPRTDTETGEPPAVPQGAPVRVLGLVATPWTMEGRSGVAFRAARIEPISPSARPAAPRAS